MQSEITIRPFEGTDRTAVIRVWEAAGLIRSVNDPNKDINRKLEHSAGGLLVAEVDGAVVATIMVGYEGHRGWLSYLGVLPAWQGRGIGSALVSYAEELLLRAGCAKVNLQVRSDNEAAMEFYEAIGYADDDVVSFGKRLVQDE